MDRVGSTTDIRFVYFGFLEKKAEDAAESLLALLERQFSRDYDIGAHFSLSARADAAQHPWSSKKGGHAKGKKTSRVNIPESMLLMRQNNGLLPTKDMQLVPKGLIHHDVKDPCLIAWNGSCDLVVKAPFCASIEYLLGG